MNENYNLQDKLRLELRNGSVVGDFVAMNSNRTRIRLKNVCRLEDPQYVARGIQIYFRNDIKSIQILERAVVIEEISEVDNKSDHSENETVILNNLTEFINEIQLCNDIDSCFYKSIEKLQSARKLGLSIENFTQEEQSKISFIALSNNANIFIYDIIALGDVIPKELKQILESRKIEKVVYDSRSVAHVLHNYNINLNPIFDTMIYKACIFKDKIVISLEECIRKYFNVSPSLIINLNWSDRPLTDRHKQVISRNVAYLLDLKRKLKTIHLAPFYNNIDNYMRSLKDISNFADHADKIVTFSENKLESINDIRIAMVLSVEKASNI